MTGLGAYVPAAGKYCPACGTDYPADFVVCPRDGGQLSIRDEFVGTTIRDTFRILRVLGEGGMARVYEAQHARIPAKRFAIKILHPELAHEPQIVARFLREAEAAASIKSPHVVDVYDVDRTRDGRPFIISEFLQGRELADHLAAVGKMDVGFAVRVVRQVCKALALAHEKGVVHRDMKPENVFLTGDMQNPTAKVLDFGISKVENVSGPALTHTGMIMGTPQYMSPEQAKGERVDHRADIYAVGGILYALLTGKKPFDGEDAASILTLVLSHDPPRPCSIRPDIPEPVEAIVQRAMAKSPAERYQSMAELEAALAPFDPGENAAATSAAPAGEKMATLARPLLLIVAGSGMLWGAGTVIAMIVAIMRLARNDTSRSAVTSTELTLIILIVLLFIAGPVFFSVLHVQRAIWGNTVKTMALAERVIPPIAAGLGAYGFASLLVRFMEGVVIGRLSNMGWPVWDVLLAAVGLGILLVAYLISEKQR
ncbi:serine/threonine-protein kinase [Polyangium aurulentum]|uniref:serine/threonine-protein kinase n=1 Tax=Polyangium aurulentum TaxID=2567896 RepID=UPI00146CF7C3|nr:serine/threonine-protein kinase [Polyangium aurulentum]UQA57212.1 serine/threonine protein kinase [Polyangium aurulentum]